jgi:hypothetical protein
MNIKKGDLTPALKITCAGTDGSAVDLTTASSVQVVCRREGGSAALFTRAATGDANGVATYVWQAGDTGTEGRLLFEVLVTWPGTQPQRFPATSYLPVDVLPNLD